MTNKKDLRVIKTQNLLYNTLIELMRDNTFESIKVSDICDKAMINRSTFYDHYQDKYELLMDYIKTLESSFLEELDKNKNIVNTKEFYIEMIKLIIDYIDEKRDVYYSILINNRNSIIIDILLNVITKDVNKRIGNVDTNKTRIPSDFISNFYIGSVAGICASWIRDNKTYSKEEITKYLEILIPDNLANKN